MNILPIACLFDEMFNIVRYLYGMYHYDTIDIEQLRIIRDQLFNNILDISSVNNAIVDMGKFIYMTDKNDEYQEYYLDECGLLKDDRYLQLITIDISCINNDAI